MNYPLVDELEDRKEKQHSPLSGTSPASMSQEGGGIYGDSTMAELFSTPDLWLGSYFLCETDAQLIDVQINRNGRETVSFSFRGKDLSNHAKAYCQEKALANVTQMRKNINTLRDFIFQARQKR